MTNDIYKQKGDEYSKISNDLTLHSGHYKKFTTYINALIGKRSVNIPHILDAGCGNGALLSCIKDNVKTPHTLYGFDFSQGNVDNTHKIFTDNITQQTLPNTNYKDETFDIITMSEVLEHLFEPLESLQEIKRILKNKGTLLLSIPNADRYGFADYLGTRASFQPCDDYFYSFAEATSLFHSAGLRVIDYVGMGGMAPIVNTMTRSQRIKRKIFNKFAHHFDPDKNRKQKRILYVLVKDDYIGNINNK